MEEAQTEPAEWERSEVSIFIPWFSPWKVSWAFLAKEVTISPKVTFSESDSLSMTYLFMFLKFLPSFVAWV